MSAEILAAMQDKSLDVKAFLEEQDEALIQDRIFDRIDDDLDKSAGSYIWDAVAPTALEFAVAYWTLRNTLDLAFPQTSHGEYLSLLAESRGVPRREAQKASSTLLICGEEGVVIPQGTLFCTTVTEGSAEDPKYFYTTKEAVITSEGYVHISIEAELEGSQGNVAADEINVNIGKLPGITSVTNESSIENGYEAEEDEILLARLLEKVRNPSTSGSQQDYVSWAKEVTGVGDVIVKPLWDGPGTVLVIITDVNGEPAGEELMNAVKNHINPEAGMGDGKAPVGAAVTIGTVNSVPIDVTIPDLVCKAGYEKEIILPELETNIRTYLMTVIPGDVVRMKAMEAVITATAGILDYDCILLNGARENIPIAKEEKAKLREVILP